jgi:hypothetical protein
MPFRIIQKKVYGNCNIRVLASMQAAQLGNATASLNSTLEAAFWVRNVTKKPKRIE